MDLDREHVVAVPQRIRGDVRREIGRLVVAAYGLADASVW